MLSILSPESSTIVQPFDIISMLGFLILMNTVVNNPILIVHRAVANVREEGMAAVVAVGQRKPPCQQYYM